MKILKLIPVALSLLLSATAIVAMQDAFNRGAAQGDEMAMGEVIMMLGSGEPFYSRDHDDNLAIHLAAKNGHKRVVDYILSNVSDKKYILNAKDAKGKAAAQLARENGHIDLANYLDKKASAL